MCRYKNVFFAILVILNQSDNVVSVCYNTSGEYTTNNTRMCYRYLASDPSSDMPWVTARAQCRRYGGDLASVDAMTSDFLKTLIQASRVSVGQTFIGCWANASAGVWTWADGSDVTYTNWDNGCPGGWFINGTRCYNKVWRDDFTPLNYWTSKELCASFGGQLAEPRTAEIDAFVRSLVPWTWGNMFLGATDIDNEGVWVWGDGTPLGYTGWADGEPNNWENEDCMRVEVLGGWGDVDCYDTIAIAMCQVDIPAPPNYAGGSHCCAILEGTGKWNDSACSGMGLGVSGALCQLHDNQPTYYTQGQDGDSRMVSGDIRVTMGTRSTLECASLCVNVAGCVGYNFCAESGECGVITEWGSITSGGTGCRFFKIDLAV